MSDTDSFINEVTEEVRRDRLYHYMRRYGWIAALLVLGVVGGTAWTEYSKATARAEAQARGDAILAALDPDDAEARVAALLPLVGEGPVQALLAAAEQERAGDVSGAIATLDALAIDGAVPQVYRDLAALKSLILSEGTMQPEARRTALAGLAQPGAPFRLLALEQLALTELAAGETDAARAHLEEIVADAEVTRGLRDRATGLLVVIGGSADAAPEAAAEPAPEAAAEPGAEPGADDADAAPVE